VQLVHELGVDMETSRCIEDDDVVTEALRFADRRRRDVLDGAHA